MQDKIGIEKGPSDKDGNEQFWIVFVDGEKVATRPGYLRQTTEPMSEQQVREFFAESGQPDAVVEAMFTLARRSDPLEGVQAARLRELAGVFRVPPEQVIAILRQAGRAVYRDGDGNPLFDGSDDWSDRDLVDRAFEHIDAIRQGIGRITE